MRNYRRFELHKGNKEKFWEIRRYDKTLYFREGNIKRKTGEKAPTTTPDEKGLSTSTTSIRQRDPTQVGSWICRSRPS